MLSTSGNVSVTHVCIRMTYKNVYTSALNKTVHTEDNNFMHIFCTLSKKINDWKSHLLFTLLAYSLKNYSKWADMWL